ncbi:hypothetical protein UA08_04404 [Talaromyces atroroseus]|uniref:Uncharacterized protein n=1 Tax=Talaromyces atroroseus TaxID=1441469 RepID=A0A1Q5Q919_TALAT|nr:hypothetical protein UA08_04404 [Talaromyces atroroseus]OKL60450.1 hypothetical protein UA08_04404 [Talaromyces atroroseus]
MIQRKRTKIDSFRGSPSPDCNGWKRSYNRAANATVTLFDVVADRLKVEKDTNSNKEVIAEVRLLLQGSGLEKASSAHFRENPVLGVEQPKQPPRGGFKLVRELAAIGEALCWFTFLPFMNSSAFTAAVEEVVKQFGESSTEASYSTHGKENWETPSVTSRFSSSVLLQFLEHLELLCDIGHSLAGAAIAYSMQGFGATAAANIAVTYVVDFDHPVSSTTNQGYQKLMAKIVSQE